MGGSSLKNAGKVELSRLPPPKHPEIEEIVKRVLTDSNNLKNPVTVFLTPTEAELLGRRDMGVVNKELRAQTAIKLGFEGSYSNALHGWEAREQFFRDMERFPQVA